MALPPHPSATPIPLYRTLGLDPTLLFPENYPATSAPNADFGTVGTHGLLPDTLATPALTEPPRETYTGEAEAVRNAISKIRRGKHGDIPPAEQVSSSGAGPPVTTIRNDTNYKLSLFLKGPISRAVRLSAGTTQEITLVAGHYQEAARVSDPSIVPFFGVQDYAAGGGYNETFYIVFR
jgi:hypothetical protein